MKRRSLYHSLSNLGVVSLVTWVILGDIPFAVAQEWTHQAPAPAPKGPWSDKSLSPDQRADLLIKQMTLEEKLSLVHGNDGELSLHQSLGGAGYVPGAPRLGIPALQMSDGRFRCCQYQLAHPRYNREQVIDYVRTCNKCRVPVTFNVDIDQSGRQSPESLALLRDVRSRLA